MLISSDCDGLDHQLHRFCLWFQRKDISWQIKILNTHDINHPLTVSKVGPEITSLAFNDRGGLLAYADSKGEIKIKEAAKKLYLKSFTHHTKAVYALDFVPKTSYMVAGSDDLSLSYMDYAIGKLNYKLGKVHTDFIRTIQCFSSSPNMILSGSYDKTVKVFDVREGAKAKIVFKNEVEVEDAKLYNSDVNFVTVGDRMVDLANPDQNLGYQNERGSSGRSLQ